MRSVLILYRTHDEDLLSLYETVGIREFGRLLKESLRILARPTYQPKHRPPTIFHEYTGEKDKLRLSLAIESKKDADIKELLSHVKDRHLGAFCKMALRFYLGPEKVMGSMLDVKLTPVLSYVPTGHIVASAGIPQPTRKTTSQIKEEPQLISNPIIEDNSKNVTDDTNDTALPTEIIPSRSLDMTMGDTVVMTETIEDDDVDILAMLEDIM